MLHEKILPWSTMWFIVPHNTRVRGPVTRSLVQARHRVSWVVLRVRLLWWKVMWRTFPAVRVQVGFRLRFQLVTTSICTRWFWTSFGWRSCQVLGRTSRRINSLSSRIFISVQSWKLKISELEAAYFVLFKKYSKSCHMRTPVSCMCGWQCVHVSGTLMCENLQSWIWLRDRSVST